MSKKGYNCDKWLEEHNQYIRDNYLTLSNEELANGLNSDFKLKRTGDAVRKQLNKLVLRRPKKSDLRKMDKSTQDTFFKNINKGLQLRKQKIKEVENFERKEKSKQKEKEAVERIYGLTEQPKSKFNEDKREMVWIAIDNKTRMQVPKGTEKKWIEKFVEKSKSL